MKKVGQAKRFSQEKKIIPSIETGDHCEKPYRCDFYNFCHRTEPEAGKLF